MSVASVSASAMERRRAGRRRHGEGGGAEGEEEEEEEGLFWRMSPGNLKKLCREMGLYSSAPELNDKLYVQCKGVARVEGLEAYTGLQALFLNQNAISELGRGLDPCVNLTTLHLNQNMLRSTLGLEALSRLDTLDLSENFLECLEGLAPLVSLRNLNLRRNKLKRLDGFVAQLEALPSLQILDLSNNDVEDGALADHLRRMSGLRLLRLEGNPVLGKIPNYRKQLTVWMPELENLDTLPIFPDDRRLALAWARGGVEEERAERQRIKEEKEAQEEVNRQKFRQLVADAKRGAWEERSLAASSARERLAEAEGAGGVRVEAVAKRAKGVQQEAAAVWAAAAQARRDAEALLDGGDSGEGGEGDAEDGNASLAVMPGSSLEAFLGAREAAWAAAKTADSMASQAAASAQAVAAVADEVVSLWGMAARLGDDMVGSVKAHMDRDSRPWEDEEATGKAGAARAHKAFELARGDAEAKAASLAERLSETESLLHAAEAAIADARGATKRATASEAEARRDVRERAAAADEHRARVERELEERTREAQAESAGKSVDAALTLAEQAALSARSRAEGGAGRAGTSEADAREKEALVATYARGRDVTESPIVYGRGNAYSKLWEQARALPDPPAEDEADAEAEAEASARYLASKLGDYSIDDGDEEDGDTFVDKHGRVRMLVESSSEEDDEDDEYDEHENAAAQGASAQVTDSPRTYNGPSAEQLVRDALGPQAYEHRAMDDVDELD